MKNTTKRITHRIYEFTHNGHIFQVDGQNHEFDSKEWELMIFQNGNYEWVNTYQTKRDAIDDAIILF